MSKPQYKWYDANPRLKNKNDHDNPLYRFTFSIAKKASKAHPDQSSLHLSLAKATISEI